MGVFMVWDIPAKVLGLWVERGRWKCFHMFNWIFSLFPLKIIYIVVYLKFMCFFFFFFVKLTSVFISFYLFYYRMLTWIQVQVFCGWHVLVTLSLEYYPMSLQTYGQFSHPIIPLMTQLKWPPHFMSSLLKTRLPRPISHSSLSYR